LQSLTDASRSARVGDYAAFKDAFRANFEQWRPSAERVLATQDIVAAMHAQLVPAQLPEWIFWCRYVYRVRLLDAEETRRAQLLKRSAASPAPAAAAPADDKATPRKEEPRAGAETPPREHTEQPVAATAASPEAAPGESVAARANQQGPEQGEQASTPSKPQPAQQRAPSPPPATPQAQIPPAGDRGEEAWDEWE
jgi:hypothetical protein